MPAVKPQSAFYEMYGLPGEEVLHRTIEYAREKGLYVILDVKRNDIGSTAAAYLSLIHIFSTSSIDDSSIIFISSFRDRLLSCAS